MEQNWNSSTSTRHYSDDTFTFLSEEEEEESGRDNRDPLDAECSEEELKPPATSEQTESSCQSLSRDDKDGATETLGSTPFGDFLLLKWIHLLKGDRAITERAKPAINRQNALKGTGEVSEEGLRALQSFCAIRINRLHQRNSVPLKRKNCMDQWRRSASQKPPACDLDCIVPHQLVNRLHLKSFKAMMEQIAETEMHQPSQCLSCMKKRSELAKAEFIHRRKTIVERVLLQEKLEEYIYTKDSLTLIGEIHKSLPKLSDDPWNIWKELNRKSWKK